jgi:hypothetical protein
MHAPSNPPAAANRTVPLSYQWNFATNGNPEVTTPDLPSNVNFSIVATGTNPLSDQWYHAPHDTTGVTNPGPEGLFISKLTPLYLKLSLDGVAPILGSVRYLISVENDAAASPPRRVKRVYHYSLRPNASFSSSNEVFTLREVKGSADNPTPILELNDTKERVSLSLGHPYQGVEGYAADLRYEPESKTLALRRVGEVLSFGGDDYEIIAITRTEVVLRQKSNNKTWAVEYDAGVRR